MEPVSALTSASKAYSANLSYKDIIMITEGEPDKYSGALYVKQSIFLARGISDNKVTIKETVYNMAVENLLNMTTAEILSQKDFGFPVRYLNLNLYLYNQKYRHGIRKSDALFWYHTIVGWRNL